MKYILSLVLVLVLSTFASAQYRHSHYGFTPTPQMRIDQIERQQHMNRAVPHNWIDHPPYHRYYYPPIYQPYYYQPYFYNPYRNFNYGMSIYGGNGIYFNYSF